MMAPQKDQKAHTQKKNTHLLNTKGIPVRCRPKQHLFPSVKAAASFNAVIVVYQKEFDNLKGVFCLEQTFSICHNQHLVQWCCDMMRELGRFSH